jgi:hypothetical protein
MPDRAPGFYWVRGDEGWVVAEWHCDTPSMAFIWIGLGDDPDVEIGPRVDSPEEARRLRAELQHAHEDRDALARRLAYAESQITDLRARVNGQMTQAAVSRGMP